MITGRAPRATIRGSTSSGTLNTFRAAAAAGVTRFVYASSVAAYGFGRDNPVGMTEQWPTRPAEHLFYAREKAEIEAAAGRGRRRAPVARALRAAPADRARAAQHRCEGLRPGALEPLARRLAALALRMPLRAPVLVPALELQLIHEDDVGEALRLCVLGAGPPGAYNIAGDGVLTVADIARELGFLPVTVPRAPSQTALSLIAALPFAPPSVGWAEAFSGPAIMDDAKARRELGWIPRYSGLEALRDAVR